MQELPEPFSITCQELQPDVAVVRLSGRIMLGIENRRLEEMVEDLVRRGFRRLIFDMTGVTHMDSTGIGRFISVLNLLMQAGGKMCLAGATGHVREGFRVTRLDTVFQFADDIDSAQRLLQS